MHDAAQTTPRDRGLDLLTGTETTDLLAAALEPAGAELLSWSLRDVDCRPGRRTTASYVAKVAWPAGIREETLGASVVTADAAAAPSGGDAMTAPDDGSLVITDGDQQVQVWRFPFDPELPGLAAACFPQSAGELLRRLGVDVAEPALRILSYRPRKRAVVEVETPNGRFYIKVMRPKTAEGVRRRHTLLADAGIPVPECVGWSDNGLIVLAELPIAPLGPAIDAQGAAACPPEQLISLLDSLPAAVRQLPRRRPWASHASHYAGVIGTALPAVALQAQTLASEIENRLAAYGDDGDEATHGDFYEAQLTVGDGGISGVLDIDTAGPGRRADDLACMLAHLSVRAQTNPDAAGQIQQAVGEWLRVFDRRVDPAELRVRTAAVVLSLATGPFRAQEAGWADATGQRLALAEQWLDSVRGLSSGSTFHLISGSQD